MDALNLAAAVSGLLSLTLQVTQVTQRHISSVGSLSHIATCYLDELVWLKRLLVDLQDALLFQNPSSHDVSSTLFLDVSEFQAELEQLCSTLHEAERSPASQIFKSLAWPFRDDETARWTNSLNRCRHRIETAVVLSGFRIQAVALEELRMMRYKREVEEEEARRVAILNWISDTTSQIRHQEVLALHHPNTGQWIFDTPQFRAWNEGDVVALWCYGGAGVGKTQITSLVAEYLARNSRVAYYYCDYQKSGVQAATTVAASLLRQLVERGAAVPAGLVEMHKTLARTGQTLKLDDITSLLCRICADTPRVRVLVDGLDEYGTPRQRRQLLHLLGKLAASGARILVMSRPHVVEVGRMRPRPVALEIRSEVSDIRSYVKHMILESEGLFGVVEDDLKEEAVECVVRQADRMFLLAVLQCALLGRLARRSEVKRAIRSLPSEIHGVYQQSMDRIEQDSPERRSLALAVLSWISHAKRPLSRPELLHALAIDPDSLWLNDDNVPSRELVVDVCAGLVVVDPGSGASRFAHYSVHEFFQQKAACQRWFPRADRSIATACLAYLRLQDLGQGVSLSANDASELVSRYPFLRYAVRYWGHHVQDVQHGDVDMIALDFLGDAARVALAARVLDADGEPGRRSEPMYPSENLAVQLAARAGALGVLELLLKQKHSPAGTDASGRTPLHWAARGGFDDVVRALLLAGGDADTPTPDGRTPLHWAAKHGHADVVEHLLRCGADPARPTADGRTAIHWAASRGHTSVVAALLADGRVEAACRTRDGWTALHWAACGGERTVLLGGGKAAGHEETVRLLLEAGVFPCLRTGGGQTALHWAAASGNAVIVRLLMDYGAAVDCEDGSGCSALLSHSYSHSGATTTLTLC